MCAVAIAKHLAHQRKKYIAPESNRGSAAAAAAAARNGHFPGRRACYLKDSNRLHIRKFKA